MRDLVLHTTLYVVIGTPRILYMHLLICAIVRVMIVRLCCCMSLESRMHGYLDRATGIQNGLDPFGVRETAHWYFVIILCAIPETILPAMSGNEL